MGQVPQDGNFAQNVALFFKCGLGKYKDNKEKEERYSKSHKELGLSQRTFVEEERC